MVVRLTPGLEEYLRMVVRVFPLIVLMITPVHARNSGRVCGPSVVVVGRRSLRVELRTPSHAVVRT